MRSIAITLGFFAAFQFVGQVAAQEVPIGFRARLRTVASWTPDFNLASRTLELTPTDIVPLSDGTGRLLIATLGGTIRVLDPNAGLLDLPLIRSDQTGSQLQQESGMTGIALHPNFAGDETQFGFGKLYTITTENSAANGGVAPELVDYPFENEVHHDVVREWDIASIVSTPGTSALPDIGVGDSRELMRVAQPGPFHNVVDLTFDYSLDALEPGYGELFITSGDGGNSRTNSSTTDSRKQTSQDLGSVYGNVLRINPDPEAHEIVRHSTATGLPAYSVSPDNPFAADEENESRAASQSLAENFAYGLRSPFRIGIDSQDGTILVSDVGERLREEVSVIEAAGNYGWGRFEGTLEANPHIELEGPSEHAPPLFEYGRDVGFSAIGGTVYRGRDFPQLFGKYVFADFGQATETARLFYGSVDPADADFGEFFEFDLSLSTAEFPISTNGDELPDAVGALPDRIFSLAEDADHELVLLGGPDPRSGVPTTNGAFAIRLTRGLGCDVDGDGACLIEDLDRLIQTLNAEEFDRLMDINWDALTNALDIDAWLRQASAEREMEFLRGDANLDGTVDFTDFLEMSGNFGDPDSAWSGGNFDGMSGTDFADFLLLSANFTTSEELQTVPEPASQWLVLMAVFAALPRRRLR